VVSSLSFSDIHDERKGMFYLSLPGSTLEKFVSRLVQTSIVWSLVVCVVYFVASLIGAGISELLFGGSHGGYFPFSASDWKTVADYLVAQSVFLFGSIYFRKAAFIKTVLAGMILALAYGLYLMIVGRIVFTSEFAAFLPTDNEMNALIETIGENIHRWDSWVRIVDPIVTYAVIPIFFWVAGFFRLRESEV
jgi:hypothetical protein